MIWMLLIAAVLGGALAVPLVSFLFVVFTFGLGLFAFIGIGVWAVVGPLAVLLFAGLALLKIASWRAVGFCAVIWLCAVMLHAGFSHGRSRWGDVASVMGGKNQPYGETLLEPLMFVLNGFKLTT